MLATGVLHGCSLYETVYLTVIG